MNCLRSLPKGLILSIIFQQTYCRIFFFQLPETQHYLNGLKYIIDNEIHLIPKKALKRFQEIGEKIEAAMANVVPPIQKDIEKSGLVFWSESKKIRNIIEAVISDIHLKTVQSTKSFEDLKEKYGTNRNVISFIACFLIFLVNIHRS